MEPSCRIERWSRKALVDHPDCVACGNPGAVSVLLEPARGVPLGRLDDYLPSFRLCHACAAARDLARRGGRALVVLLLVLPALASVGLLVVVPVPHVLWALAFHLILWLAALGGLEAIRRRRTRSLPVLLVGGEGKDLTLQIGGPPAPVLPDAGPYRSRSIDSASGGPRRAAMDVLGWSAAATLLVGSLGAAAVWDRANPLVVVDNRFAADVRVRIDGRRAVRISALESHQERLHFGTHRFAVSAGHSDTAVSLVRTLPWGEGHLLATDPTVCYQVTLFDEVNELVLAQRDRWIEIPENEPHRVTPVDCHTVFGAWGTR